MKHFHEALRDSLASLKGSDLLAQVEKVCLIVDLEGRFRALVKPDTHADSESVRSVVDQKMKIAAEQFWTGEVWVEIDKPAPADQAVFNAVWTEAVPEVGEAKIFVLHRRVSKDSWFDQAADVPWPLVEGKTPPVLSFYSYKGGVGRSTALASVAIQHARKGKRVLVIDFDLEAPGLASIFPPPEGAEVEIGVVDYLLERPVVGNSFPFNELSYIHDTPAVIGDKGGAIHIIPAGAVDSDYLEKLARINYQRLLSYGDGDGEGSPLHAFLKDAKKQISPDVILIDSRAGLHDLGGLALSSLVHRHVLFGLDSEQSWRGIRLAIRHLGADRVLQGLKQQECVLVQSMASPKQEIREASIQRFLERSYEVFTSDFYDPSEGPEGDYPVPDLMASSEPHNPVVIKHSEEIMGYNSVDEAADALCSSDFVALAERILPT